LLKIVFRAGCETAVWIALPKKCDLQKHPDYRLLHLEKCETSIKGTNKNRVYRRNQGNDANDSLTQRMIDGAVKEFLKRLNTCVVSKGGHFYYSQ